VILVAGLTPAWQQIYLFNEFQVGEVNRAQQTWQCASGKNLNVGYALKQLAENGPDSVKVISTAGGGAGLLMKQDFQNENINTIWVETESQTRICTTILDQSTKVTSELVENSPSLTEQELNRFKELFQSSAKNATVVVMTGSLPEKTNPDYYSRLLETTSAKTILDIRGAELKLALNHKPFLVKPNREELESTLGKKIETTEQLLQSMRNLNQQGAEWVLISNGSKELWLTSSEKSYCFYPPEVEVVNPIGCGDCLTAGIAWGIFQNSDDVPSAIQTGIASAVLNLGQILPARINAKDVKVLSEKIVFKEVQS
jgi:tagatose 6-phosphate kinase